MTGLQREWRLVSGCEYCLQTVVRCGSLLLYKVKKVNELRPNVKRVDMISIEQWRARIGLFNNKRGCSGFASLLFSPVFFHYCYGNHKNVRSREYSSTTDTSPSSSSLPSSLPLAEERPPTARSISPNVSLECSTSIFSSSSSSPSSGGLFSLRHSLLRDVFIILLITIISQQLLMSGDIETNPGPRHGADDKPGLDDLLYMSYTGEDGRDVHFRLMDQLSPYWRRLAIALKFSIHEIATMKHEDDPVFYLMSEWLRGANQEKDPRPVTWRTLIKALQQANVQEEAAVLEKHFIEIPVTVPNSGVELCFTNARQNKGFFCMVERLKQVYRAPPRTWNPLPHHRHVKLAMIREKGKRHGIADEEMVKHQMEGAVETIMASKVPVDKDKIFDSGLFDQERQVILVEGPPGGGKTSLAYYYGQKWATGNYLCMFDVVAIVQLRDLAVTPASTLHDLLLLACCATKDDTSITKEMIQQYCPKLLLVLDGWDEAPNDIRKLSYIANILHSITSQSKILITSRPDSSVGLHSLANRVEILGFTEENIHEYFMEVLSTELDHDKVEDGCRKLKEHFRNHPVIQSCCSIPLNAAILANLFLSEQSLPSTRHELFLNFVLSCINRELQHHHYQPDLCLSSFDDLPHNLKVQLINLGILAFEGVKQNKVIFMDEDLVRLNLPLDLPSFGVLQMVYSFTIREKTTYRYFIHLSTQELLAAYLISLLGEDEQVQMFEAFLYEPRFSAVLQFYAAFTRFTNQGVRNIITERDFDSRRSFKLNLLSFIGCFFEAQIHDDTSLYQQIIPRLNGAIELSHITMTPLDCMSIGHFMAMLLRAGGKVSVHLSRCSIDDYSLGLLLNEFSRHAEVCPAGVIQAAGVTELDICGNDRITEIGITHVLRTNITQRLNADCCGMSNLEMESLARALAVNSTLEELNISDNSIGDNGIGHIGTALLINTTLKILNISRSADSSLLQRLDTGTNYINGRVHICTALQQNNTLKTLDFSSCGLSDLVAESLARALAVNSSLNVLNIVENNISDNGIAYIATSLQMNNTLKVLHVGTKQYNTMPVTSLTDTGVLSLARGVATNTSIECLSIQWSSTDPDSTLKMMAKCVKNSSLKVLTLTMGMWIPSDEAPTGSVHVQGRRTREENVKVWCHRVELGGNELILSLEDSRLESFELTAPSVSSYGCSLQFKTAENSVNLARHEKGLPNIHFKNTLLF